MLRHMKTHGRNRRHLAQPNGLTRCTGSLIHQEPVQHAYQHHTIAIATFINQYFRELTTSFSKRCNCTILIILKIFHFGIISGTDLGYIIWVDEY